MALFLSHSFDMSSSGIAGTVGSFPEIFMLLFNSSEKVNSNGLQIRIQCGYGFILGCLLVLQDETLLRKYLLWATLYQKEAIFLFPFTSKVAVSRRYRARPRFLHLSLCIRLYALKLGSSPFRLLLYWVDKDGYLYLAFSLTSLNPACHFPLDSVNFFLFLLRGIAEPQLSSYTVCLEDKARLGSKQRRISMEEGNSGGVGTNERHIREKEIHSCVKNIEQRCKLTKF